MEAIFHLLGIAAGQRWHGGPRAEAGAETTTGGVFFALLFSRWFTYWYMCNLHIILHPKTYMIMTLLFQMRGYCYTLDLNACFYLGVPDQTGCRR